MKLWKTVALLSTHGAALGLGFALGIYALPILTAPPAPAAAEIVSVQAKTQYSAEFVRELKGSDLFHWGEGRVALSPEAITFTGKLAPGPDYKLYLSPVFVETEADFNRYKSSMVRVGDVKTFNNFIVDVAAGIDVSEFNTVIVWCESFGEFITAARYKPDAES